MYYGLSTKSLLALLLILVNGMLMLYVWCAWSCDSILIDDTLITEMLSWPVILNLLQGFPYYGKMISTS